MLASSGHVSIGGVEYLLAVDEDPPYPHRFESLFAPTSAIAGEIAKEQIRPEKLLWAITDWSGGEGALIFYPQDPTSYDIGSLINATTRGKLTTRPARDRDAVARTGAHATTEKRPAGTSAYANAFIAWEDNIITSTDTLAWTSAQDVSPAGLGTRGAMRFPMDPTRRSSQPTRSPPRSPSCRQTSVRQRGWMPTAGPGRTVWSLGRSLMVCHIPGH